MTSSRRPLAVILLLALALRLWVAAHVSVIAGDGITRIGIARAFQEGGLAAGMAAANTNTVAYHPFNPLVIRCLAPLVGGDLERAGFADSILFGVLAVLGMYLLAREAFGEREGLLAALVWALLPNAVHFSSDVLTEGQFMAFWILAAWAGLRALRTRSGRWALGAGALAGLAYETRVEGVGILLALGAALAVLAWRDGRSGWRRRGWQALALVTGFLLLAAPYLLALRQLKGEWMLSGGKSLANLITIKSSVWTSPQQVHAPEPVPAAPPEPLRKGTELKGDLFGGVTTVTPWVLILAVLGLWSRRPWRSPGRFLVGLGILHAVALLQLFRTAGYISHRHFLPLAALAVVWAAATPLLELRRWLFGLLCAVLALQTCWPLPLRGDKRYRREFGERLALTLPPGEEVATLQGPEIPYYARHPGLDWSAAPVGFVGRMRRGQVLILEREADAAWVSWALSSPLVKEVPLETPFSARFAAFRKAAP